jgi:hypothetical protein
VYESVMSGCFKTPQDPDSPRDEEMAGEMRALVGSLTVWEMETRVTG